MVVNSISRPLRDYLLSAQFLKVYLTASARITVSSPPPMHTTHVTNLIKGLFPPSLNKAKSLDTRKEHNSGS